MLTEQRQKIIMQELKQSGILKLKDIIRLTSASESSVRRDFMQLEKQGRLKRVHGGVQLVNPLQAEETISQKSVKNVQKKQAIAYAAAQLIEDDDVCFLDAGSTIAQMLPFLRHKKMTIVTNSVQHAAILTDLGIAVYILGGQIKPTTQAVLGPDTTAQLMQYQFTKAFLGMNSLDLQQGYTTPDPQEAAIKRIALKNSTKCFALVDDSKFNTISFSKVAPLSAATIITNTKEPRYAKITTVLTANNRQGD